MTMTTDDDIDEAEVWVKFSATHHYRKNPAGKMEYVNSEYFKVDPLGIEPLVSISKAELVKALEPER